MNIKKNFFWQFVLVCILLITSISDLSAVEAKDFVAANLLVTKILPVPYIDQVYVQSKIQKQDKRWYNQIWYLCGPSSTDMALAYFGYTNGDVASTKKVAQKILINPYTNKQTNPYKIPQYLSANFGIKGSLRTNARTALTFSEIKKWINKGKPILLGVSFTDTKGKHVGHIVLIVGYKEPDIVVINDPFGSKIVPKSSSRYWWSSINTPPSSTPRKKGNFVNYKYSELKKIFGTYWYAFDSLPPTKNPVTLVSPSDATNIISTDVTFTWNSLRDADQYYLEYSGTSSGNSGWISATTYIATLPTGEYTWHVKGRNSRGEGPWSLERTITTSPVAPLAPTLVSPIDNSTINPDITFTWNSVTDATEYFIEYTDTSSGTSSGDSGWISDTTYSATLPAGTYTWRVKARNAGGESEWSAENWAITVQPLLSVPMLTLPNNASVVGPDVAFSWDGVADATEYFMEYTGTSSGDSGWTSDITYSTTLPAGIYNWRVKARNADGEGGWSESWTVTVPTAPTIAPTLLSPTDASTVNPGITLTWESISDATEYFVEYIDTSTGTPSGNSGWISDTTYSATLPIGSYIWHVKTRNAGGEGPLSADWALTVEPVIAKPPAPVLVSPLNNANLTGTGTTLTWNIVSEATEYYLEYSGPWSGNSGWISSGTSFPVIWPTGTYTWHVKARNAGGEGVWSETWTIVQSAPAPLNFVASQAAYAQAGYPTSTGYGQRAMFIGYSNTSTYTKKQTRVYLKYNLPNLGNVYIVSARIRLGQYAVLATSSYGVTAYRVTGNWGQTTLTWNAQPAKAELAGSATFSTGSGTKEIDITNLVRQWYAGTYTNYGVTVWANNESAPGGIFCESGTATQCLNQTNPRLYLQYEVR